MLAEWSLKIRETDLTSKDKKQKTTATPNKFEQFYCQPLGQEFCGKTLVASRQLLFCLFFLNKSPGIIKQNNKMINNLQKHP